jgi:hypothetical protein
MRQVLVDGPGKCFWATGLKNPGAIAVGEPAFSSPILPTWAV